LGAGLTCINCNSTSCVNPVCGVQLIQYQSLAHQVLKCSCEVSRNRVAIPPEFKSRREQCSILSSWLFPQRGASEPSGFRERLQAGGCSNAQIHWHNREQKKQSCSRYIPSRSPTKIAYQIPYQNLFQQISTRPMDVSCHRVIYGDSRHHLSSESPRFQRPLDMEVASAHGSGPSPVSFTRKKARDAHLSTHATGDGGVRPPPSHWI
jgi:hypothetical protein